MNGFLKRAMNVNLVALLAVSFLSAALEAQIYKGPGYVDPETDKEWKALNETEKKAKNQEIFEQYCVGTADSTEVPNVNYSNEYVLEAAKRLSQVEYNAFYFYSGPAMAYGLKRRNYDLYHDYNRSVFHWVEDINSAPKAVRTAIENGDYEKVGTGRKSMLFDPRSDAKPKEITDPAHVYLLQLCGEFRDRATMIEAKLAWVHRLIKLPAVESNKFNPKKDLWEQMTAYHYEPFIRTTAKVWDLKDKYLDATNTGTIEIGPETHDTPVEAMTICETRYAFNRYVINGDTLSVGWDSAAVIKTYEDYAKGLKEFEAKNCSEEDVSYYYDYRGDSNLKHYSPESNGMIWHASSVAGNCLNTTTAKTDAEGNKKISDKECAQYFKSPFKSRWNAARAGLGAWMLYDEKHEMSFREEETPVYIFPFDDNNVAVETNKRPYSYGFGSTPLLFVEAISKVWQTIKNAWVKPDYDYQEFAGYGPNATEEAKFFTFNRLRNAVNRHTNWYQSGFNDGKGLVRTQAYSPLVASSYEPHESDAFTAPGYTVGGDGDGRKYWMYVFRVPVKNLVTSATVKAGQKFNLDTAWLDETSLGDTELADKEKAFDRLGTVLEGEFDTMLYIHNIKHDGGGVEDDHGVPLVYNKK